MNKTTLIIWALILGAAIISSVLKKKKKPTNTGSSGQKKPLTNYNKPTTTTYNKPQTTQPKSLEDILQSLLGEQKPQKFYPPKVEEQKVFTDKEPEKYTSYEDTSTLEKAEKEYYSYDTELNYTEEVVDYDETSDHHVHGVGFDDIKEEVVEEQVSEWADIDWRKAIITAEILKRPEY